MSEVAKYTDNNISKMVLANKKDLDEKRKITKEEIQEFEKNTGIKVIEVSAKTGEGVEDAFRTMVETLIEQKYFYYIIFYFILEIKSLQML